MLKKSIFLSLFISFAIITGIKAEINRLSFSLIEEAYMSDIPYNTDKILDDICLYFDYTKTNDDSTEIFNFSDPIITKVNSDKETKVKQLVTKSDPVKITPYKAIVSIITYLFYTYI